MARIRSREHDLLRYYIDCIESEGTRELVMPASGRGERFLLLIDGEETVLTSDLGDWRSLASDDDFARWATKRSMASRSERLLYGYPLITGETRDGPAFAPLFYAEIALRVEGGVTSVRPESALIETSLFALDLLGVDRQERGAILDEVDAVDDPPDAHAQLSSKLLLLADLGVIPAGDLPLLDPAALVEPPATPGVANTAMVFVGERALVTRQLLEDLEELATQDRTSLLSGPLGILLGEKRPPLPPPPQPQPSILPTNLSQDRAITSAMANALTVVTGPPGTGKSQVLVNTVAAAIDRGETLLFASKNNQAVDVVFERLASVSDEAVPLRVGAARLRGDTSQVIRRALARSTMARASAAQARGDWARFSADLGSLYRVEGSRVDASRNLAAQEAGYASLVVGVPSELLLIEDPNQIERFLGDLERAVELASKPIRLPLFRSRRREARSRGAHEAWITLRRALPEPLRHRYAETLAELDFLAFLAELTAGCDAAHQAEDISSARRHLDELPDRWDVQEQIRDREEERIQVGRKLFDASWVTNLRSANPGVRAKASAYADGLANLSSGKGGSAARLRSSISGILPMFPVWGVTNLSARTNLPLSSDLFDLVVIDEASQCDIASALPLLFRAKRALIIGDRNQLIHVSTLPRSQEEAIARHNEIADDDGLSMGYRSTSLFGLAARRVGEDPIFLEEHYRSHRAIITFSNDLFYGSRLIILTGAGYLEGPAVRWVNVEGTFAKGRRGSSVVNEAEVQAVARVISKLARTPDASIGVVTPYRAQVEAIRDALERAAVVDMTVDTAHRFQGDERDIIVFSATVSSQMPQHYARFAGDANLVNVSVTRARQQLVIVGDQRACVELGGVLGHLATYVADLEEGRFESPIERRMYQGLVEAGHEPQPAFVAEGYRLDLALLADGRKLDIECDGAATHVDRRRDAIRDAHLQAAGWQVIRFSGRQINNDLEACVSDVEGAIADLADD